MEPVLFEGVVTDWLISVFGSSDKPIRVDVELGVALGAEVVTRQKKKKRKREQERKEKKEKRWQQHRRPLWICVRLAQPNAGSLRLFIRRLSHRRRSSGSQLPDTSTPIWRIRWQPRGLDRPREMPTRLPNTLRNEAELDCRVTVRSGRRI